MTARTVDLLLDERARVIAQRTATEAHLWRAEWLLRSVEKMLPHLIADSPHNGAARDSLATEIGEFLREERYRPGTAVTASEGEAGAATATEGS